MKIYRFTVAKNIYKDIIIRNNTIIVNSFILFNEELKEEMSKTYDIVEDETSIQNFLNYLKTDKINNAFQPYNAGVTSFFSNVLIDACHVDGPAGLVGILLYEGKTVLNLEEVHQRDYTHYMSGHTFKGWSLLNFINTTAYTSTSKDSFNNIVDFLNVIPSTRLFLPSRYSKLSDNSGFMIVYENEVYPTKFTIETEGVEVDEVVYQRITGQRNAKLDSLYKQHMPTISFEELERTAEYVKLKASPVVVNEISAEQEQFAYPMRLEFSSNCGYIPVNQYEYNGVDSLIVYVYLDKVPVGHKLVLKANTSTFSNLGQYSMIV